MRKKLLFLCLMCVALLIAALPLGALGETALDDPEQSVEGLDNEADEIMQTNDVTPTIVDSGTCGENLTWTLDDQGTLIIDGEGAMGNYIYSSDVPWYSERSSILSVVIGDQVTAISSYAFYYYSGLKSVTIGQNVETIGDSAFSGCNKLTSVTIGQNVTTIGNHAFSFCRGLTSVTIGNNVTIIGNSAFDGCSGLTSLMIPNNVMTIGSYAFSSCSGLTEINYDAKAVNDLTLTSNVFYEAGTEGEGIRVNFGEHVEKIPAYLFYDCKGLTSVTIGQNVTTIGSYAFSGCSELTGLTIPNNVTSIGSSAFSGCRGLTSITIPDNVTTIGSSAFSNCTGLTEINYDAKAVDDLTYDFYVFYNAGTESEGIQVNFGEHVEKIPAYLFCAGDSSDRQPSIKKISIGQNVIVIGDYAFYNCGRLTSVTIPDSVTTIGNRAFYNCSGLTTLIISQNVMSIGDYAFYNCGRLTSVTIPDSVTTIGNCAFYNCSGLTSIAIPEKVEIIGERAFGDCINLTEINYDAKEVNDLLFESNVFINAGTEGKGIRVNFGEQVEKIPAYLFYVNQYTLEPNIKEITIGRNITTIGSSAFERCSGLSSVTISQNVTTIGDHAFRGCSGLTGVTIPDKVTTIGSYAFSDCTNLTEINYNAKAVNDLTSTSNVFYNAGTTGEGIRVNFGEYVEKIPAYLFYVYNSEYRPNIRKTTIGQNVANIGDYAFWACSGLTSVTIPDKVTTIGSYAFAYCSGLTSATIGQNVTTMGDSAFYGCSDLSEINYNAKALSDLSDSDRALGSSGSHARIIFGEKVKKIPAYLLNQSNITDVIFSGNAPVFSSYGLSGFRGTAYYPKNNDTWTSSVRQNYGGTVTWKPYSTSKVISSEVQIEKNIYAVDETNINTYGISFTMHHEDGTDETHAYSSGRIALGDYDMTKTGWQTVTATCKGITETCTANFKIYICPIETRIMDSKEYPESSHPYKDSMDQTYTYKADGARSMNITFSADTATENNVDYIYVNGTQYTGTSLAGKTIKINGDTLTIRLTSDSSDTEYGFSIDEIEAEFVIQPEIKPESVSLDKTTLSIADQGTATLTATILPENTTDKALTWTSSNESIATVDQSGKVTGHKPGTATITVKTSNGKTATCTVTITAVKATSIKIDQTTLSLKEKEQRQLNTIVEPSYTTTGKVSWKSGNEQVATVNQDGQVTAKSAGTATITASIDGLNAACTVTVTPIEIKQNKITLNLTQAELKEGETTKLTATVSPDNATDKTVTWSSSNPSVATVDANGNVTAKAKGNTTITATANDGSGVSASCAVTVNENPLGDVNLDGVINAIDGLQALRHAVKESILTGIDLTRADVDKNNEVNSQDALLILEHSVGKRITF